MSLRQTIQEFIKEHLSKEKLYSSVCTVVSVDTTKRTCQLQPINGDAERKGRIQASLDLTEGIYIVPVVGSYVTITYINNITGIITSYSEITSMEIKVSDKNILIDANGVYFNGAALGGLPITSNTVSRLNLIENDINDLKTAFSSWVVAPTDGGLALKTITATWYGSSLTNTVDGDIENTEVQQ